MQNSPKQTESAGGVVINPTGLVLVVNQQGRSWSLPKGHVEAGESKMEAVKREIFEESGTSQLEFVSELGSYQRHKISLDGGDDLSEIKTISVFLFRTDQADLNPRDPDNPEARWVKPQEVVGLLTHRKDKEFFASILERIRNNFA